MPSQHSPPRMQKVQDRGRRRRKHNLFYWLDIRTSEVHKEGLRAGKGREGEVRGETMTICNFIPWSNAKGVAKGVEGAGVCDAV